MTRIAYIASLFPKLSETFVFREVNELRRQGMEVVCFSLHRPPREPLPADAQMLQQETTYLWPLRYAGFVAAVLKAMLCRPRTFYKTLALFVKRAPNWPAVRRYLLHFLEGVYLARLCRQQGVEYLHAHFANGPSSVALAASEIGGIPFGFTCHAQDIFVDPVMLAGKVKRAQNALTISAFNRTHIAAHFTAVAAQKMQVQRVAVDLKHFAPVSRPRGKVPIILAIGRLVPKKGFIHLVHACALLARRGMRFRCWIIGDGPERAALEMAIAGAELQGKVRLLGAQSNVKKILGRTDIFAMPCVIDDSGDRDGIPTTLMEAMAMALPVVSTEVSGIPELIHPEETGLLAAPGNAEQLASQMTRLLQDESLCRRLGEEARRFVAAHHNLECNTRILFNRIGKAVAAWHGVATLSQTNEEGHHAWEIRHHLAGA